MKMSIGNHARQSSPDRYSGSFCSTVSFAILHEGFPFARRFCEVGWIQHCDVTVFEKFRFTVQNEENTKTEFSKISTLERVFEKLRFRSTFSPDACGRKSNLQRKSCAFNRKRIRVDGVLIPSALYNNVITIHDF